LHLTVLVCDDGAGERAAVFAYGGSFGPIPLAGERSLGALTDTALLTGTLLLCTPLHFAGPDFTIVCSPC
jgi:hypothetical protein